MFSEVNMFNCPYIVELLSPKRTGEGQAVERHLDRFANRYQRIIDAGLGLSIPDNAMGQPRMGALGEVLTSRAELIRQIYQSEPFHTKHERAPMGGCRATAANSGRQRRWQTVFKQPQER